MVKHLLSASSHTGFYAMRAASFAALNQAALDSAIRDHASQNWGQFLGSLNPQDVAESDPRTVGKLLKALTYASSDAQQVHQHKDLYKEIDEYFRKRFRKLTT